MLNINARSMTSMGTLRLKMLWRQRVHYRNMNAKKKPFLKITLSWIAFNSKKINKNYLIKFLTLMSRRFWQYTYNKC